MSDITKNQRDHIGYRESDSPRQESSVRSRRKPLIERKPYTQDKAPGSEFPDFSYPPSYEDEFGMRHPFDRENRYDRWDDEGEYQARRESFIGRGPMGYKRSEDRIREDACDILTEDPVLDASGIEVEVKNHNIILRGEVATRKDKKRAEYLVEDISGVHDVQNLLTLKATRLSGWVPGLGKVGQTKGEGDGEG
jgi:hypothetical protein